jgi:proliferating cell nuclear antigen
MSKLFDIELTTGVANLKTLFEILKDNIEDVNIDIIRDDDIEEEVVAKEAVIVEKKKKKKKDKEDKDNNKEVNKEVKEDLSDASDVIEISKVDKTTEEEKNARWGGMRILTTDSSKALMIHVKLNAKKFNKFECKKKLITIGVNLTQLYKIIRSIDRDVTLQMYVNNDDKHNLVISVIDNENNSVSISKLKLLDTNKKETKIPDIAFEAGIKFKTEIFHKVCREFQQLSEHVEIRCTKDVVAFACKGDSIETHKQFHMKTDGNTSDNSMSIKLKSNAPPVITGIYELKYINMFNKCTSLCGEIQIFMKNNYPICIQYAVATLGFIKFCLSPTSDEAMDRNYEEDDDFYNDD